jgi:3-dehydroquinate dehydratase-2
VSKILVIHGPNLNLLGQREPEVYGTVTLEEINRNLKKMARYKNLEIKIVQSNHEGEIVEIIGKARGKYDFLLINPAAYTHTSLAIRDAIVASEIPTLEVHLSNIYAREEFRRTSLIAPVAKAGIYGLGPNSYYLALEAAAKMIASK